jgi:hypothetical protein
VPLGHFDDRWCSIRCCFALGLCGLVFVFVWVARGFTLSIRPGSNPPRDVDIHRFAIGDCNGRNFAYENDTDMQGDSDGYWANVFGEDDERIVLHRQEKPKARACVTWLHLVELKSLHD